jgi:hypothetical protein
VAEFYIVVTKNTEKYRRVTVVWGVVIFLNNFILWTRAHKVIRAVSLNETARKTWNIQSIGN